jgi:pimeloyl-ACP methyl ester carboxylesterase
MDKTIPHSAPAKVAVDGVELVYDTFGESSAQPMLFIAGLGAQMIAWDEEFCEQFAARGFWVIRFDNRDVGLSTKFDEAGVPDIPTLVQAQAQGETIQAPYLLRDMADDAIGLLDALAIENAHVVGISMGGMIAQEMVIHHPRRVRTLTSIMSSPSPPSLSALKPEVASILLKPAPSGRAAIIEGSVETSRVLNGPGLPLDENRIRERAGRSFDRGLSPAGTARQLAAILASGSRTEALRSVTVPTLVVHGDADPLVPVEGGIETANAIPGAERLIFEGMGHLCSPVIWPQVVRAIVRLSASPRASTA